MRLTDTLLRGVGAAGALFDLPGSMVRDVVGGENPFDQLMTPFSLENRLTGRDLLRQYGLAGQQDTGMGEAGGVVAEMALDPLMWAGGGALSRLLRGAPAAARTAGRAPVAASLASPVMGAYLVGGADEGEDWRRWLGQAMIGGPMVYGMAKGLGRVAKSPGIDQRISAQRQKVADLRSKHSQQVWRRESGRWRDRKKAMDRSVGAEKQLVEGLQELDQMEAGRPAARASELRDQIQDLRERHSQQVWRRESGRWRDRKKAFERSAELEAKLVQAMRELDAMESGGIAAPGMMVGAAGTGALARAFFGGDE